MTHKLHNICAICILLFTMAPLLAQETVYLEATEFGRGILKERAENCYVIAPAHVVENTNGNIEVIGDRFTLSQGKVVKTFPSDLAVLRLSGGDRQNCAPWGIHLDFDFILDSSYEGFIELRNNNGSSDRKHVMIIEFDESVITIQPKSKYESIAKGMSGSSLFTLYEGEKIYLGMLMETSDGKGYVLQSDDIDRLLYDFFNVNKQKPKLDSTQVVNREVVASKLTRQINADIHFLNEHFEEIQNQISENLAIKFSSFLSRIQNRYNEYPANLQLDARKKLRYQGTLKELNTISALCKKLIRDDAKNWDTQATPQISMMLIHFEDLLDLIPQ